MSKCFQYQLMLKYNKPDEILSKVVLHHWKSNSDPEKVLIIIFSFAISFSLNLFSKGIFFVLFRKKFSLIFLFHHHNEISNIGSLINFINSFN